MNLDPECIPCLINQAYRSSNLLAQNKPELQVDIIKKVCMSVDQISYDFAAPMFSYTMQSIVEESIDRKDPYREIKKENLEKARHFLPYLQTMMDGATDKLGMALRIAIAGNTIDLAANPNFSIEEEVNRIIANKISRLSFRSLREDLKEAGTVLYIGDNFEEALFDKFLLNQIKADRLVFAVRSYPIFNDITLEDAKNLEIDKICEVIESGNRIAGTDLNQSTKEFKELFEKADVVIAKGQGNYETLMDIDRPVYFLFKVKCESIARRCGLSVGSSAFYLNHQTGG